LQCSIAHLMREYAMNELKKAPDTRSAYRPPAFLAGRPPLCAIGAGGERLGSTRDHPASATECLWGKAGEQTRTMSIAAAQMQA